MSKRVVIDPITRIEGHLRVEVEVDDNNVITKAWSSSTLWRGIEVILKGRTPMDRPNCAAYLWRVYLFALSLWY